MDVTDGKSIKRKLSQYLKQLFPIVFNNGALIVINFIQLKNAPSPIDVTFGKLINSKS